MGRIIGVDFETTYEEGRSVTNLGSMTYAMHPDTEVIIASIDTGEETIVGDPYEIDWEEFCQPGDEWVSHNRTFDKAVYWRVTWDYAHMWNDGFLPQPERWHCSADLTACCGVKRSLDSAALHLLGIEVDKSFRKKMKGLPKRTIMMKHEDELYEYAAEDATLSREIWVQYSDEMTEMERWVSEYTTESCHYGVGVDLEFLDEHLQRMKQVVADIKKRIPWDGKDNSNPKGKPYTVRSKKGLGEHCLSVGVVPPTSTAKDSPIFTKWLEKNSEHADFALALGQYRSADRVLGLLQSVADRTHIDSYDCNVMPFDVNYRGTVTMRTTGSGGFNMLNMSRDATEGVKIRNVFVPRFKDRVFVVVDLSQIEAVVLLWEAGDEKQLNLIRGGMDLYEAHGRQTMGYRKEEAMKIGDPVLRKMCKVRVLGLGYMAGAKTFRAFAASNGLDLTPRVAAQQVAHYRQRNREIVRYWEIRQRSVLRGAAANHGDYYEHLPSGNKLFYRDVKKIETKRGLQWAAEGQVGMGHRVFHGGLLTENRISAIARDSLMPGMRRIHSEETPVLWSIYDELVIEVPRQDAEMHQATIEEKLTIVPDWAPGLPLGCESHIVERYDKV